MSEKRFTWKTEKLQHLDDEILMVVDNENKEWKGHILNIVDLLNFQNTQIKILKEENDQLNKELEIAKNEYLKLMEKNCKTETSENVKLSFSEFVEKYKYKRSEQIIAYELYLILKKLDELEGNVV